MTKPIRIQRKREKGWRMPPNTVYVGRPGRYGNRFRVVSDELDDGTRFWSIEDTEGETMFTDGYTDREEARRAAIEIFEALQLPEMDVSELRGKNLCCWCPLDKPCHADVLLELANK